MEFVLEEVRQEIAQYRDIDTLRKLRDRIHENIRAYPQTAFAEDWNEWVNVLHDDFIRLAVSIAEGELIEKGWGPPPKRYAFLLVGSGGRREQTLWSDQDNGMVYEDPSPGEEEQVQRYFQCLGETIVDKLYRLGYPPCEGKVMCSNPLWGNSVSHWNATMNGWLQEFNWENVRYLLIMADARCIYGDAELVANLKNQILARAAIDNSLLGAMLRNTLRRKASLTVLGNLIPERYGEDMGGIDIKYGSYIPIVNAIRLLAIRYGIAKSGTLDRISALTDGGHAEHSVAAEWRKAFDTVLQLRSLTTYKLEDGYYNSSGILPGSLLTKDRKKQLKSALRTAQKLHKYVEKEIQALETKKG